MILGLRLGAMRKLATLLVTGLVLVGCSSAPDQEETAEPNNPETDSSQTDSSEGSSELENPNNDVDALPDLEADEYQTIESIEEAAIIAANTFDRFQEDGIVETLRGEAGNVVLVHNPDQKDQYSAAWINTSDDAAELIFDTREFTSAWPFLLLSEPGNLENTYFGGQPGGFTLEYDDPSFGRYGYNYLTDGQFLLGAWWFLEPGDSSSAVVITYDYAVQQKWKDRLDVAVEEFLAEQPAE